MGMDSLQWWMNYLTTHWCRHWRWIDGKPVDQEDC